MEAALFTCPREKNKERDLLAGINSEGLLQRTFMTTAENRVEKKSCRRGKLISLIYRFAYLTHEVKAGKESYSIEKSLKMLIFDNLKI